MRPLLTYAWPPLAWAGLIFIASSIPGNELPSDSPDKIIHVGIFAILALLVVRFFLPMAKLRQRSFAWALAWSLSLSLMYAATDEVHQLMVPNRACEWSDFFADAAGIAAVGIFYYVKRMRHVAV